TLESQPNGVSGKTEGSVKDGQLYDELVARLKFQLSAIEVRAPAILPGGSRSNGLASIAEASNVTGSGLAGAIIQFFGMLWPNQRRVPGWGPGGGGRGGPPGTKSTKGGGSPGAAARRGGGAAQDQAPGRTPRAARHRGRPPAPAASS